MTGDEFMRDHKDYAEREVLYPFFKELLLGIALFAGFVVACWLVFSV